MILVTARDGSQMYLNPDHIEIVIETPDTHITLTNGNRYLVLESARVVIERIVTYRAKVLRKAVAGSPLKYLARKDARAYNPPRDLKG